MTFSIAELRILEYFVRVADSVLPQNNSSRPHLPLIIDRISTELRVSRERNETSTDVGELDKRYLLSTAQAAKELGCSQRRVQQRIKRGELPATQVGRDYFIDRRDIA